MKKYPLINGIVKRRFANTQVKCKCGNVATCRVEIRVNYMRGDDAYFWSCDEHKKDIDYLLGIDSICNDSVMSA